MFNWPGGFGGYDITSVLTHEFGHCLGMEDQLDAYASPDGFVHKNSVMWYQNSGNPSHSTPQAIEIEAVEYLYGT